jgi:glycosyltransferase involved in cell wall biosynthesis
MNIHLVSPSFYPATVYGGPIFSTLHVCEELVNLGNTVRVSTTNMNRPNRLDVEVGTWIPKSTNFYIKYYNDTIKERFSFGMFKCLGADFLHADFIHVNYIFSAPTAIALYYARKLNKPLLLSPRGSLAKWILNNGIPFKKQWLLWLVKPHANRIFWHATSVQEKEEILDLYPQAKVVIISNGLNLKEISYTTQSRADYIEKYTGIPNQEGAVFVSMARLQKKKAFDVLIKSFSTVLQSNPSAYLIIAGQDDGEKEKLNALIHELNLTKKVFLIGQLDGTERFDFLANADVFVLPSHNENFGNVYAEALICGTPIIASTFTPWAEVIDANCGDWVPNTVEDTAAAMNKIIKQDLILMSVNAKVFSQQFAWTEVAKKFDAFYKNNR